MQRLSVPNPWGLPELKELIASQYNINTKNIILTQGATNAKLEKDKKMTADLLRWFSWSKPL
ncbi:MAG: hypothetical protein KAW92_09425 [Candidatus Cloacimonetes bacterium]|nr:hypothetical protein [Candidatus Cloacimonadota bacterium]